MKLSVLMITYNQEPYIREAIDSVLAQRTDFEFELVVGEDCSTDGTRSIVRAYEAAHPGKVRGLYPAANLGMCENLIRAYQACRGEYVAMLEGDDYWVHPLKLQKQADFLDARRDCGLCFHDAYMRTGGPDLASMTRICPPDQGEITFTELLAENGIPTCSVLYRRRAGVRFPKGLDRLRLADWPLHLMHAHAGPAGYLAEAMSVYRINPGGVWSQLDLEKRVVNLLEMYKVVDAYFGYQYAKQIARCARCFMLDLEIGPLRDEAARLRDEAARLRAEAVTVRGELGQVLGRRAVRLGLMLARLKGAPRKAARVLKRALTFQGGRR